MTSLTIVVHGVSPYLFRTITSKFNSANRNAFLQTLREENPLLDGIVDDSLVFLVCLCCLLERTETHQVPRHLRP